MSYIAICDDDIIYMEMLEKSIRSGFDDAKIKVFVNSEELFLSNEVFDIIFLDIDMPFISGFEVAEEIRKKNTYTRIVFVSGKDSMVVESIHYSPFRFVRKQYFEREIKEAVRALREVLDKESEIIEIVVNGEKVRVPILNILYVEALSRKSVFHLKEFELSGTDTFEKVCKKLAQHGFIQIHRSYLVNYKVIKMIEKNSVIIDNNIELPMSKYKKKQVLKEFQINLLNERM